MYFSLVFTLGYRHSRAATINNIPYSQFTPTPSAYTNQAFSYINNIGRAITGKGLAIASIIAFMLNRRYFYLCVIIIFTINSIASCATDLIMFPIINNGDFREPETIYLITVFTKLIVPAISCILYYLAYKDKKTT